MKQTIAHRFIRPYDRQQTQRDLTTMVLDYFNNNQQEHPLTFCSGLDVCFYAAQDCLYGKKRCYYE